MIPGGGVGRPSPFLAIFHLCFKYPRINFELQMPPLKKSQNFISTKIFEALENLPLTPEND